MLTHTHTPLWHFCTTSVTAAIEFMRGLMICFEALDSHFFSPRHIYPTDCANQLDSTLTPETELWWLAIHRAYTEASGGLQMNPSRWLMWVFSQSLNIEKMLGQVHMKCCNIITYLQLRLPTKQNKLPVKTNVFFFVVWECGWTDWLRCKLML